MRFRPFLWLTIVSLPALLVLVGLGSWQLQRLQWKNDLIASFESRAAAPPIAVPATDASLGDVGLDDVEFRRLALVGTFQHDKEVFLTGRTYEGNAGFHIVTPFQLDDGRIILINRGWVSEDLPRSGQACLFADHWAGNGCWHFAAAGRQRIFRA